MPQESALRRKGERKGSRPGVAGRSAPLVCGLALCSEAMPLPLVPTALPLLLALSPMPSDAFAPVVPPSNRLQGPSRDSGTLLLESSQVETFDPIARAGLIASQIPRLWNGSYSSFDGGGPVPVNLVIASTDSAGQMVVMRGTITIGGVASPVQGNLNAKSDQLDLLVLGAAPGADLGTGGAFQGLQGLSLSGWNADRLTMMGGRLQLLPVPGSQKLASETGSESGPGAGPIRGLW